MKRIGYVAGDFDLFHIGHLNILRYAKSHCDYLIVGVISDEVLRLRKFIKPVIPLEERIEIVRSIRFVDRAIVEAAASTLDVWRGLHFDIVFKGDDGRGTEKDRRLEGDMTMLGVEAAYLPDLPSTSSTALREALENIKRLAGQGCVDTDPSMLAMRRALQ
ncbi:adenylyltransferase/cytidyltransferase family protein [Caballeronia mineralivorans]|jgi:glycerol-3-phosphate cytidylyltransferase|uniref:adenylyltransferase/cytidyltransferase family protein n=1 Tax=Caballeronia mineralivorans TaxID=2010198 RepID=UPI0023F2E04B|nr:adenylyltransferase/cytidyltransferase family protein [Caballeronia mineralivorans]MDB5787529.1 cytidyltransferase [Caballeronia mineralivorans]MEA3105305.1 glycerol-3-phosphate cytidylyltransferase [Caballeronia mineralivorans]